MANLETLEEILKRIEETEGITDAVLVSRSGMHIAGEVPKGAHTETFVAMSAILLGAAETATTELKEKLRHVTVDLERSKTVIVGVSTRALLVIKATGATTTEAIVKSIDSHRKEIEESL
ncbi:MAG: roadblock/LC7 domain-containing protein [Euryarchaeota archaeon]|nr:roadblock/LC7 domain-containing protein [Euryarchaeota archaeon]